MFKSKKIWWLIVLLLIIFVGIFIFKNKSNNSNKAEQDLIKNNTIRLAVGGEPASLDPNLVNGTWEARIDINLFEGLTVKTSDGNVIPGVALKWNKSKDGKTYTFYLRQDAKWSDGVPVTAHDFEFSIKRLLNPKTGSTYANILYIVQGGEDYHIGKGNADEVKVKAIDDYTLTINLTSPAPYFLELLANTPFLPIPKHLVLKKGKAWSQPVNIVSNGAYKIASWKPRAYVEAIKNPHYWDKKNVKINKIIFYTQDDHATLLKRYRANELDILPDLGVDGYRWAMDNAKNQVKVFPYMCSAYYVINLRDSKFKNPKVRLALNMAIDRDFITNKVLQSPEMPVTYSLVPPGIKGYEAIKPGWANWTIEKRIDEAKKLLKQAGYDEKNPLSFSISYNTLEANKLIAVAMAAMWKRIGVNTKLFNKEVAVHYADMLSGKFEVGRAMWAGDYTDPSTFISLFTSDSGNNYIGFKSSKYDKEYCEALNSSNNSISMQHYRNAEQILLNTNSIIPLYHDVSRVLVKPWVKGFDPNYLDVHLVKYMSLSN